MLRPILLIRFIDDAISMSIRRGRAVFLHIPEQGEGVQAVESGDDSPEGKNAGFTHAVLMTCRDEAARLRDLPHPAYKALGAILTPLLPAIIVLDHRLQQQPVGERHG